LRQGEVLKGKMKRITEVVLRQSFLALGINNKGGTSSRLNILDRHPCIRIFCIRFWNARDGTKDITHARQVLYHQATSSAPLAFFCVCSCFNVPFMLHLSGFDTKSPFWLWQLAHTWGKYNDHFP
jgi:hypothetical protein